MMKRFAILLFSLFTLTLLMTPVAFAAPGEGDATTPVNSATEPGRPHPNLPDPNDPDSPDTITIEEDGVPLTFIKVWDPEIEEFVYIPEDDVPLSNAEPEISSPQTGTTGLDVTEAAALLAVAFGAGGIVLLRKAREDRSVG